jgi:hypothetical protein
MYENIILVNISHFKLCIAAKYQDETIALIFGLFAYGNAGLIVKFLDSLDF